MSVSSVSGFNWDNGNWPKCGKHGVSREEIEACFEHEIFIQPDPSDVEARFNGVGQNDEGRKIFVVFTIRTIDKGRFIRPISARYMHKKEIERYEGR